MLVNIKQGYQPAGVSAEMPRDGLRLASADGSSGDTYDAFSPNTQSPGLTTMQANTRTSAGVQPPLLSIDNLSVSFSTAAGSVQAVRNVSMQIGEAEFLGLVGESGSGKSVTAHSILGLLPSNAMSTGSILFDGRDLTELTEQSLREVRGSEIAMVFQNPMSGLNPVLSIGNQLTDTLRAHESMSNQAAQSRSADLLDLVGLPNPRRTLGSFPHELSGGMQQRVMIAMALAHGPRLLIADEPTTALDVTIQAQIMEVLLAARDETGVAIMLITHNLGLVAGAADQICVMYGGQIFESGTPDDIFYDGRSPYARALLAAQPRLDSDGDTRLVPIQGQPQGDIIEVSGCAFRDRCPYARAVCEEQEPELIAIGDSGHEARCLRLDSVLTEERPPETDAHTRVDHSGEPPMLEARDLVTRFTGRSGFRKRLDVAAVDGVNLRVGVGETLGVVGESGSGKTTLGRTLARLVDANEGEILLAGRPITDVKGAELRKLRGDLQIVFQDPYGSLNPRMTARQSIEEPLRLVGTPSKDIPPRVLELSATVGLSADLLDRRPAQLSGGQLQRIGIARALAVSSKVIVLDEPVSALDISIQAEILNLLRDLQYEYELTYIFITHDLSVTRHVSDRVAVMYLGQIVETADTADLFDGPAHPYTEALLSAVPIADPNLERERSRITLEGERPDPANPPSGCRFHTRCPAVRDRCTQEEPVFREIDDGHWVACHYPILEESSAAESQPSQPNGHDPTRTLN